MAKRRGPQKIVSYYCTDCVYSKAEKDYYPNDPGWDYYCTFGKKKRYVGCTSHAPKWCPLK